MPELQEVERRKTRRVVFVFYTLSQSATWQYSKLPTGWTWTGSGSTGQQIIQTKSRAVYKSEEQFNGPKSTQPAMRQYLATYFSKLVDSGIVKRFKIRSSFKP